MSRLPEDEGGNIAQVGAGKLMGGVHKSGSLAAAATWINTTPFNETDFIRVTASGSFRYRVTDDSEYTATVNDHLIGTNAAQFGVDIAVNLDDTRYEYVGFYAVDDGITIEISEYE